MTFCVEMTDITKYYSQNGVLANDDISLEVYPNEIHAIIGENGAGKTTLMKVLYGLVRPDHGEIRVYGKNVKIHSPKDAAKLGIFMLQQHSSLINEFTVTENIVLNREPRKYGIFYDREKADRKVQKILNDYDFKMDPKEKIQNLSMHQRQQVEIAKALYQEADILILDEPTAFLPEQEMRFFFQMLKGLIQEGKTILIISHKINEVKDLADRITILRRGKMLGTKKKSEFDMKKISELMIGKTRTSLLKRKKFSPGKIILELKNLCFQKKKALVLNKVNFQLRKGEILGIAGISGNGLDALEDILFGFARASSGQILYQEQDITYSSIKKRRNECNISYIPADNLHRGASLEATVLENLLVCHSRSFWKSGIYPDQKLHGQVKNFFQQFHVSGELNSKMKSLSGGNIQKTILSREIHLQKDLIIFSEPTAGLDIKSSEFVHDTILKCRNNGGAILLFSSNLNEILTLSDTISVIYKGQVTNLGDCSRMTKQKIAPYMVGIQEAVESRK